MPTALIVAKEDQIGDARDNAQVLSLLPNVVFQKVYDNEDHLSLQFSKNMTYFKEVMPLIDKYMLQELTGIAAIDRTIDDIKNIKDYIEEQTAKIKIIN